MLKIFYTLCPRSYSDESRLCLSEYRKQKLRSVKAPALRGQMITAELLLNQAVRDAFPSHTLPLDIVLAEGGKPCLKNSPFFFSLSHSGPYVACALADYEIGLDIQERSIVREPIVKHCFSVNELEYLDRSEDADAAFTEIWCLKESYVKAIGTGLKTAFSDFSLSFSEPLSLENRPEIRFWLYGEESFKMAVCSLNGCTPIPEGVYKTELRLR